MIKATLLSVFLFSLAVHSSQAQNGLVKADTLLVGTWKGTSICQIKNSPCHDETVVYHISKSTGADNFNINASKIVNGVEEEMGILPFVYNEKTKQLTSTAHGIWTFNVEGDKLEGTLFVQGNLYRKIMLRKQY